MDFVRQRFGAFPAPRCAWQRASTQAASLALDQLYGNGYDDAEKYAKRISHISRQQIQQIAADYLDLNKSITVCVGPKMD